MGHYLPERSRATTGHTLSSQIDICLSVLVLPVIGERVHNAQHKNVTSALNTTFLKTSGL